MRKNTTCWDAWRCFRAAENLLYSRCCWWERIGETPLVFKPCSQGVEVSPAAQSLVVQGEELQKHCPCSGLVPSLPNPVDLQSCASRRSLRSPQLASGRAAGLCCVNARFRYLCSPKWSVRGSGYVEGYFSNDLGGTGTCWDATGAWAVQ